MKGFFLVLPLLLLACSFQPRALAAESEEDSPELLDIKVFEGKVALIYTESPMKSFPGRVEAVDEGGQRLVFVVTETTKITKNRVKTGLRSGEKGDNVIIEYTADKKNRKIAQSVRLSD